MTDAVSALTDSLIKNLVTRAFNVFNFRCPHSVIGAIAGTLLLMAIAEFEDTEDEQGWPFAHSMLAFNMCVEALSMVPQLFFVTKAIGTVGKECADFVGALSVARLFRIFF